MGKNDNVLLHKGIGMEAPLIEDALRESEKNYRGIFENAPIGIFQSHPDGRFLSVNPALARMLGYESSAELMSTVTDIGKQLYVDPERLEHFIAAAREGKIRNRCEIQLRRKDERIITTYVTGKVVRDEDGTIRYLVGVVEDITDHKRTEEELRRSERRYRRLVESSPEAIFILREGRIVLANNTAGKLFRAANPIALLGRSAMDLVDKDYRDYAATQLRIVTEKRCRLPFVEEEFVCLDGTIIPVEVSAIPFVYEGCSAVQWVVRDISEQKRAEEAIRRQNEYLTALHETSLGLVSRLEPDELLRSILFRAAALVQAPTGFLYLYDPSSGDLELKVGLHFHKGRIGARIKPGEGVVGRVWQTGRPLFVDRYALWPGRISDPALDVVKSVVGIPLKLGSQVLGVIGLSFTGKHWRFGSDELSLLTRFAELASIALDNARLYGDLQRELTERLRMDDELLSAKEAAEAASRSKSDFLASMSHELRTPLNAIIGFTELTVDQRFGMLNDIQTEYLGYVLQSSRHLLSLINDVLDLAKVEAGKLVLELGEVKLDDVLFGSLVMVKEKALTQGIVLSTDLEQASGMTIMADKTKLKQILYNLLSNAVKFTPDGGEIRLSARKVVCRVRPGLRSDDPEGFCFVLDACNANGCESSESAPVPSSPLEETTESNELTVAALDETLEGFGNIYSTEAIVGATVQSWCGKGVEISVSDTGIGISQEDIERIFKPFEQGESPLNRRFQGTGLGLSLTKRLVELHGGRVWAESEGLGKGSTFRFVIPVS